MSDKGKFDDDKIEEEFEFLDDDTELLDEESFDADKATKSPSRAASASSSSGSGIGLPNFMQSLANKRNIIIGSLVLVVGFGSYYALNNNLFAKKNGLKNKVAASSQNTPPAPQIMEPTETTTTTTTTYSTNELQKNIQEKTKAQDMNAMKTELFEELLQSAKIDPNAPSSMEIQEAMKRMNSDIYSNTDSIMKMQYNLKEIAQAIAAVNNSINALEGKISSISGTVESNNRDISGVKRVITDEDLDIASKKAIDETIQYKAPEYTVHAVIPGRAWLKEKSGKIVTITEGDALGKYGTISNIDVVRSIVSTSSGTSFR